MTHYIYGSPPPYPFFTHQYKGITLLNSPLRIEKLHSSCFVAFTMGNNLFFTLFSPMLVCIFWGSICKPHYNILLMLRSLTLPRTPTDVVYAVRTFQSPEMSFNSRVFGLGWTVFLWGCLFRLWRSSQQRFGAARQYCPPEQSPGTKWVWLWRPLKND